MQDNEEIEVVSPKDMVSYKGTMYEVRNLYVPGVGLVAIATESLGEALIDYEGNAKDDEAEMIDATIFFYLPDVDMIMSDEELIKELGKQPLNILFEKTDISGE